MLQTSAQVKKLLKELGVSTRGLTSYDKLYGTTPFTFGYKNSSMWAYTYSQRTGAIEVNTTYFKATEQMQKHNYQANKKYWLNRYNEVKNDLITMSEIDRQAWESIKQTYTN